MVEFIYVQAGPHACMENHTKIAAETKCKNSVVLHALCLECTIHCFGTTLLSDLNGPGRIICDIIIEEYIIENLERKCEKHYDSASQNHWSESLFSSVKQLASIFYDLVFKNEVQCKSKPYPEWPSEDELVYTMYTEE